MNSRPLHIILSSEKFWGIYNPVREKYSLVSIDIDCPDRFIATDNNGDRYQVKIGEYAMQMQLTGLSDVHLPTQKL